VTLSIPPGSRLLLLSSRPAVTFPTEERHRPSADTKLYGLVTETQACEQLAQGSGPVYLVDKKVAINGPTKESITVHTMHHIFASGYLVVLIRLTFTNQSNPNYRYSH